MSHSRWFLLFVLLACALAATAAAAASAAPISPGGGTALHVGTNGALIIPIADDGLAAAGKTMGARGTTYVYIANTGTKYHRKGCRYLAHSRKRVSLSWAKRHGYKPCKVCRPPR